MEEIVSTPDVLAGEPRIDGHRISVIQIRDMVEVGDMDARTVATEFNLDVADVYRALVYYHEHVDEMASIKRKRTQTENEIRETAITGPADVSSAARRNE